MLEYKLKEDKILLIFIASVWIIFLASIANPSLFNKVLPVAFIPYALFLMKFGSKVYRYHKQGILNQSVRDYTQKHKKMLLFASVLPLSIMTIIRIGSACYATCPMSTINDGINYYVNEATAVNIALMFMFSWILSFVYYAFLLFTNEGLSKIKKIICIIIMLYLSMFLFPILWYVLVYKDKEI